jgi:NDP-sugar pyrophosphorylase family protein
MKAFILAGGFGNKLREIIYNQPKILATIKGQAFIDHLFYLLKKRGFTEVILGLGYLGDMVKDYATHQSLYDLPVVYSMEPRPLGTAGSLKLAEKYLDTPFFVINGDTYLDIDYAKVLDFHKAKKALVTIIVAKKKYPGSFSIVEMDKSDKVTSIVSGSGDKSDLVHAGIYVFIPEALKSVQAGERSSIEKDLLPELIKKGKVFAYQTKEPFFDIGDAEGYKLASIQLER